jgi:plexin-like protein
MKSIFTLASVVLSCVLAAAVGGCPTPAARGCLGGLDTKECFEQCAGFKSCSECAAQPSCGWCADEPGSQGSCIPALNGEDHRSERPNVCARAWFYRTNDLSVPPGAPFCPAP